VLDEERRGRASFNCNSMSKKLPSRLDPTSTDDGLCMRARALPASVTTSTTPSAVTPGNPAGADSIEAELQVLLTMASKIPRINVVFK